MVKDHASVMEYLPTISEENWYIEREFLFDVVNTIDPGFFRDALAEVEARRTHRAEAEEKGLVEIDEHLYNLIAQC